jgi:predicted nuclease of restriction endonuclease-like (RecB) superfamily
MSEKLVKNSEYRSFIQAVKQRIQSAQIKAAIAVNQTLLQLYWDLAEQIVEKQRETSWGDLFLEEMSRDLKAEFPDMKGFFKRNLELMRQWYRFWREDSAIAKQVVSQIPWGHNLLIISRSRDADTLSLQEKSVMQYFQSNDSITVKVVGELLSVKDSRAREIVKALTEKGLLMKKGTARSTYYVRV